jgi:hypothetical protein
MVVFIRSKEIGNKIYHYLIKGEKNKKKGWVTQRSLYIGDKEALKELLRKIEKKLKE